ncbi:class I SAM-dependent methyltransferase [Mycolicibacterium confluentis]|uniref:SAM-dependent methyltransferase n=1 Tax=Mycolicibacterium confluentis TaxID=28047 RepID=A0A7I7XYJ1_9MYCO|nr:class I SAM-dependent methyltransferase [Mycolicibacterium confluentis]MCV7318427.1 methyltransferase domain-containing protein [Mycolicibacterium confluentis]ORV20255.1 SAM-dependent methyltransferase [Mycolicibacterium confluentis]BBZ34033.1 SAM-dependent methyltransferase [Mycolicibacterium confluentis]
MTVNEDKLNAFLGRAIDDLGAAFSAVLILIGDELGLYSALGGEPLTAGELAERTGTSERYIREWLANQAAGGYVEYDADGDRYHLSEEQALCLTDPNGPMDLPGGYSVVEDFFHIKSRVAENFRSGAGMEWGEHHPSLFCGTERFFRAGYHANLLSSWLPALDGMVDELEAGALVADVGCGHGVTTILMAQAFPKSQFVGIDYHDQSIETARTHAAEAGAANARFEVGDATSYPGGDYNLIAFFDCLHDMADPAGAARHARESLAPEGRCMLVEPAAGDSLSENLNPVGRVFYGASSMVCVPVSLARHGPALGAQAGERRLAEVMVDGGGFSLFRRVAETPFNLVFEARA